MDEDLIQVEEAQDDAEELPEDEEQALALNADGLQYWLKEVILENIKLEKQLRASKESRLLAAEICRHGSEQVLRRHPRAMQHPFRTPLHTASPKPNAAPNARLANLPDVAVDPSPGSQADLKPEDPEAVEPSPKVQPGPKTEKAKKSRAAKKRKRAQDTAEREAGLPHNAQLENGLDDMEGVSDHADRSPVPLEDGIDAEMVGESSPDVENPEISSTGDLVDDPSSIDPPRLNGKAQEIKMEPAWDQQLAQSEAQIEYGMPNASNDSESQGLQPHNATLEFINKQKAFL